MESYYPKKYMIYFWSTNKIVQPYKGERSPRNDSYIALHDNDDNYDNHRFAFVPRDESGHFGYIEHVSSGMVVHPYGGKLNPGDNTYLILHEDKHAAALFAFDEDKKLIIHKGSGKVWQSYGGTPNPKNDTCLVLHSKEDDSSKFYLGDVNGKAVSPYLPPSLSGDWELVKAFTQPSVVAVDYTVRIGRVHTKCITSAIGEKVGWNISDSVALETFSASPEFSGLVQKTTRSTWSLAVSRSLSLSAVEPGKTAVAWQYVFRMARYGEEYV